MTGIRQEVGRIKSTSLGIDEDHGIFTFWLNMDYGGSGQGVGGYNLTQTAHKFVPAILKAVGVSAWEQLAGKTIFVLFAEDDPRKFKPLGIEALPMDRGSRLLFAEVAGE